MRVLLTGSRGYIGTVMAPMMVQAGHEVVGLDTDLYRRSTFGPWRESIRTLEKDVRAQLIPSFISLFVVLAAYFFRTRGERDTSAVTARA